MDKVIDAIATEAGLAVLLLLLGCITLASAVKLLWTRLNEVLDSFNKLANDNAVALTKLTAAIEKVAERVR